MKLALIPPPILASALAVAVFSIFVTAAQAGDTDFYAGASLGLGESDKLCDDGPHANGCTDDAWAAKTVFGYRFNRFVGAEASLAKMGEVSYGKVGSGITDSSDFELEYSIGLSVIAYAPLFEKLTPFARVGFHKYAVKREARHASTASTVEFSEHEDGTDLLLGIGAEYQVGEHVSLRAEWERLELDYKRWPDDEADIYSLGIAYFF